MFITFAEMGQAFIQAVLLMSILNKDWVFKSCKTYVGVTMSSWRHPGEGSEG